MLSLIHNTHVHVLDDLNVICFALLILSQKVFLLLICFENLYIKSQFLCLIRGIITLPLTHVGCSGKGKRMGTSTCF